MLYATQCPQLAATESPRSVCPVQGRLTCQAHIKWLIELFCLAGTLRLIWSSQRKSECKIQAEVGLVLGAEVQCHIEKAGGGHQEEVEARKAEAIKSRREAVGTGSGRKVESYSWWRWVKTNRSTAEVGLGEGGNKITWTLALPRFSVTYQFMMFQTSWGLPAWDGFSFPRILTI